MRISQLIVVILMVFLLAVVGINIRDYNSEMDLPYIQQKFTDGEYGHWNSSFVSIGVTGNYTRSDLFYLQNVMNEWNTKIKTPKLGFSNNTDPDILIRFDPFENEEWAGCMWAEGGENNTIVKAYINVRTSWPFARECVIRHELGHSMGLSYHSNHPNSAMYKYANGAPCFSNEDIKMIKSLYNEY